MVKTIVSLFLKLVGILAPLFLAKRWGKESEKRKQAEGIANEKIEDARISSGTYVDRPFSRMREKD